MAKYLIEAVYTAEGLQGLMKDKAAGRRSAVENILATMGGKLEAMYFAFGKTDVFVLCDCPDAVTAAALSMSISSSGVVQITTIPLLTIEEIDQALSKGAVYRAPGAA